MDNEHIMKKWIDFDHQYTELLKEQDSSLSNRKISIYFNGKGVFVENNLVYKLLTNREYNMQLSFFTLCEALNIKFLSPMEIYYNGALFKIVSQPRLTPIELDRLPEAKNFSFSLNGKGRQPKVNQAIYKQLGEDKFLLLQELAEIFTLQDIYHHNLGWTEEGEINLFDYEIQPANEMILNNFLSKHLLSRREKDPFYHLFLFN